jgi:mono/diheme cytochrome c family protein
MRPCLTWLTLVLPCCAILLDSCATTGVSDFPTAQQIVSRRGAGSAELPALERGRQIYASGCTECHVARPIARFSTDQWREIISAMAPRAGLQPDDRAALETYILSARASLVTEEKPNG